MLWGQRGNSNYKEHTYCLFATVIILLANQKSGCLIAALAVLGRFMFKMKCHG